LIKLNTRFTGVQGGKGPEGLIICVVKNEEKYELKIATLFKRRTLKSSLSDAQSTKVIAIASFTRL
jgi:hypothetical protein